MATSAPANDVRGDTPDAQSCQRLPHRIPKVMVAGHGSAQLVEYGDAVNVQHRLRSGSKGKLFLPLA